MTAFGAIFSSYALTDKDRSLFNKLSYKLNSQIDGLHKDCREANNLLATKMWIEHAKTQGFANDEHTKSWLACIGNPSYGQDAGVTANVSGSLLSGYLTDGPDIITSLNAPFVVVIFDGRDKSLNVVTDRIGIQHIYMAKIGHSFIVSTSSLALASVISVHLDRISLANYFLAGHLLEQRSFFEEIKKIEAATWLRCCIGNVNTRRYWVPPIEENSSRHINDISLELSNKLAQAVSRRISPYNRTSLELTGGLDSRLNLACAALSGKPFHAWTIGESSSLEVRITKQLRQICDFQHYVLSAAKDLETCFMDDLQLINVLTDGETNCLNLIASPSCNRQTAKFRDASISGLGGEILRGFYYISHKGVPNRVRKISTWRLINLKILPNIGAKPELFSDVFPSDHYGLLKQSIESYFSGTADNPLFWRLDDFYLRAREQRFAGRSCSFNNFFYRQELPFFDNEVVDFSFRTPHQFKKNSALVKRALAICHPGWSNVLLENGLPARALSVRDVNHMIRYYVRYAKKVYDRAIVSMVGKTKARPDNAGIYSMVTENLMKDRVMKLMDPENMASGFLYDPDELRTFVSSSVDNRFKARAQIGLILSFELLCRQVGSSLKIP